MIPIVILLSGELRMASQEGGYVDDAIYVDGVEIGEAIGKALGIRPSFRGGMDIDGVLGVASISIDIIPDANAVREIKGQRYR